MKLAESKLFLPVYKLNRELARIFINTPKDFKTTFGALMMKDSISLIHFVSKDLFYKDFDGKEFRCILSEIIICLRLANDCKFISINLFTNLNIIIEDIRSELMEIDYGIF